MQPDNPEAALADLAAEFRALLDEVRRERRALFEIVIRHGDLPTLHEIAGLLEQQRDGILH